MKKVVIIDSQQMAGFWRLLFGDGFSCVFTTNPTEVSVNADLVVLRGGASDVNPALYNQEARPTTIIDPAEDELMLDVIYRVQNKVPLVGICRGAQIICVKQGGSLYQHVYGHEGGHDIIDTDTGETLWTEGNHHQMMDIGDSDGQVIAYGTSSSADTLFDPEVVYFPEINALAVQYHPEWMLPHTRGAQYFHEKVEELL